MRHGQDGHFHQAMRITTVCLTDNYNPPMVCLQFQSHPIRTSIDLLSTARNVAM
jgi:hypothetical protein